MKLLNEKISSTVYHITSAGIATQILKTGEFKASEAFRTGRDADITPRGYNYYISTARSRRNAFSLDYFAILSNVMFVLDGNKLNTKYKGGAVDFFSSKIHSQRPKGKSETEDRIFLKKPVIKNFTDYITEVLIYVKYVEKLPPLLLELKKRSIPYYLFTNVKDIYQDNKKNALTPKQIIYLLKKNVQPGISRLNYNKIKGIYTSDKKLSTNTKNILLTVVNLYFSKSIEEFMRRNKSVGSPIFKNEKDLERGTDDLGIREMLQNINWVSDIMRDDKDRYIPEDYRYIKVLEKILTKEKARKIFNDDLVEKLTSKWQSLFNNS